MEALGSKVTAGYLFCANVIIAARSYYINEFSD